LSNSLVSRFIGGTVSVGLGNVSTLVLGLVGTVIAVRHLPAEEFGSFVLIGVVASFLTAVSSFGLDLSIAKFVAGTEDERERGRLVNTAIGFRLLTILAVSLIAFLARPALSAAYGSSSVSVWAVFVPILFLLQSARNLLRSVLQGFYQFGKMGLADLLAGLLNLALLILLVVILKFGFLGLICARILSSALSCAFLYFSMPVRKRLEFDYAKLREMLVFGMPLQINDVLTVVFRRIDSLVIGILLGPTEIAYYEIARKIPDNLMTLYDAFRSVYFPLVSGMFAREERDKVAQVLNNSTRLISFVTAAGAVIALLFGRDIIVLLFSERYLASVPVFVVLMVALNLSLIGSTLGISLVAVGDSDKPAIINIAHTAVSLLGTIALVPSLGILGAAITSVVGSAATNPLNFFFLRKRLPHISGGNYMKPIAVAAPIMLATLLVKPDGVLPKVMFTLLFLAACWLLSIVTRQDVAVLFAEARITLFKPMRVVRSRPNKI
jgi:O-antigen/teichoic acid export membrane protein